VVRYLADLRGASERARPTWVVRRWSDDDQAMIGTGFLASQIIRCML
jgi:hypothetical protein